MITISVVGEHNQEVRAPELQQGLQDDRVQTLHHQADARWSQQRSQEDRDEQDPQPRSVC